MSTPLTQLIQEISQQMQALCEALGRRAEEIRNAGNEPEVAKKLAIGAGTMRDSGHLYLTWARHYASLAEGNPEASDEEDEADFEV